MTTPDSTPRGALLANLGTPEAPTPAALRVYLREFLSDRRVVDWPRLLWLPILHGIILRVRPRRSAHAYAKIWTPEGSPLLVYTQRLAAGVRELLERDAPGGWRVAVGMRYGRPSLREGLLELHAAGCRDIAVLPLYPQYSGSTTGSTDDGLATARPSLPGDLRIERLEPYYDHPQYIAALATRVREVWARDGGPAERLLLSFHGIPKRYARAGDPYPEHCRVTAERLAAALELPAERWKMTFQSRFGPEPWLQPYTDRTLAAWGREKLASVDVVCPGFAADCLETLEEIGMQNRAIFEQAGGGRFRYVPALNDHPEHVRLVAALLRNAEEGRCRGTDPPEATRR